MSTYAEDVAARQAQREAEREARRASLIYSNDATTARTADGSAATVSDE